MQWLAALLLLNSVARRIEQGRMAINRPSTAAAAVGWNGRLAVSSGVCVCFHIDSLFLPVDSRRVYTCTLRITPWLFHRPMFNGVFCIPLLLLLLLLSLLLLLLVLLLLILLRLEPKKTW